MTSAYGLCCAEEAPELWEWVSGGRRGWLPEGTLHSILNVSVGLSCSPPFREGGTLKTHVHVEFFGKLRGEARRGSRAVCKGHLSVDLKLNT